ncbi:hypothetical protein TWF281_005073 [Arthrobotrys megalospora]
MVLKSPTAEIWLEKPSPLICLCSKTHQKTYQKSTSFCPSKSKEISAASPHYPAQKFKTREAFIESSPDSSYRIALRLKRHFFTKLAVQVIIDGIEQGTYLEFPQFFRTTYRISGRRVTGSTWRGFQFTRLNIKEPGPGVGDYVFNESQHCEGGYVKGYMESGDAEPIDYMIGKNAVGSIRVNFYKVKGAIKEGDIHEGYGDWEPCTTVDEIGALKLGVQDVTTLGPEVRCRLAETWYSQFDRAHPFETFVFKYRPHDVLEENNLLLVRLTRFQKLTRWVREALSFPSKVPKGWGGKGGKENDSSFAV